MRDNKKKIGIDARLYGPLGKGLGRYAQEIADRIIKLGINNEYIIFLSPGNFDQFECKDACIKKVLVKARWYSLAEQIIFPWIIWRERLDLMHFMHFNVPIFTPVKFVVTIHDLILTKFPSTRSSTLSPLIYKFKNLAYKIVIWTAAKRARKIIAVSNFTRDDIIKKFKVSPEKVVMIYEGVTKKIKNQKSKIKNINEIEFLNQYKIIRPYLLYVGNAYPHKNLERFARIFKNIKKEIADLNLVYVGGEDYFYQRLKKYTRGIEAPVIFTGFVPDEELRILYKNALAYVFPSRYEGFGLPPLEAMSQGCAVLSSNRTSMPEVLGDAALYFDPENEEDVVSKVKKVIQDERLREELRKKGFNQIKKYDWDDAARETLEIYNRALS